MTLRAGIMTLTVALTLALALGMTLMRISALRDTCPCPQGHLKSSPYGKMPLGSNIPAIRVNKPVTLMVKCS